MITTMPDNTYRPNPRASAAALVGGEYRFSTRKITALAEKSAGKTTMAEIAAAIGPPNIPAAMRTSKETISAGA